MRGAHVKSHQEMADNVPLEVRLNDACDRLAKDKVFSVNSADKSRPLAVRAPDATVTLVIDEKVITNNYKRRLLNATGCI